jgi:hypothetical protein
MKAAEREPLRDTLSTDVAELLVAELRARRKHVQRLITLVHEQAGREFGAKRATLAGRCRMSTRRCTPGSI